MDIQNSLIPAKAGQSVVVALNDLLDRARDQTLAEHGNVAKGGAELESEITLRMLAFSENHRKTQQVAQGFIVAYVARKQLWRNHPDGFTNLRYFLQAAGLSHGTVCDLVSLGDIIVPFCDHHGLGIDRALTIEQWPKLREAISALRRAAKSKDAEGAREILEDVKTATSRDAVREKYRVRRANLGHGTTLRLPDGRVLLVAVLDDEDAIETVVRRLSGALKWDLVVGQQAGAEGVLKLGVECAKTGSNPVA